MKKEANKQNVKVVGINFVEALAKTGKFDNLESYLIPPFLNIAVSLVGFLETEHNLFAELICKKGGNIVKNANTADVIVCEELMDSEELEKVTTVNGAKVVTSKWIEQCLENGVYVDEADFSYDRNKLVNLLDNLQVNNCKLFQSLVFFVDCSSLSIFSALLKIISASGGFIVRKPVPSVNYIVSDFKNPKYLSDQCEFYNIKIVKPTFVIDAIKSGDLPSTLEYMPSFFPLIETKVAEKEFTKESNKLSAIDLVAIQASFTEKEQELLTTLVHTNNGNLRFDSKELDISTNTVFVCNDGYLPKLLTKYKKSPLVSVRFITEYLEREDLITINIVNDVIERQKKLFFVPLTFKGPFQKTNGLPVYVHYSTEKELDAYNYKKVLEVMGCKLVDLGLNSKKKMQTCVVSRNGAKKKSERANSERGVDQRNY